MGQLLVTLAFILFFAYAFRYIFKGLKIAKINRQCQKDPTKQCPYKVEMTVRGGMRATGHFGCCKVKDQMKALNKWIANSEPDKTYGEFSFSKEIIEQAKREEKLWDELDSSGPTEYKQ